ncbi:MSCRAMM family adhesin SdrC [Streptomyces kunmingensis]|uniref:MSCRAMM family adhesin SdrC n=1 Tax=Streptomyces kunmingensis TaxID=68225 RepID=A0ABU6CCR5_9ACTN|nr:hypothetical protein [Streptomyces kunmingensis]MEB3961801.1 MSCRAMM family adhesin SdrC [Streptomyces kunmingensis]
MGVTPDNSQDEQSRPKGKKRVDLSVPQVAGSAVAAVVAAKLASSFGVYGTILGAGVVSAIATCGGTVFQHFFSRTGEQIRDAAVQTKPKGRRIPVTAEGRPVPRTFRSDESMDATTGARATGTLGVTKIAGVTKAVGALPTTTTWGTPSAADAEATTVLPQSPADDDMTQVLDTGAVADLWPDEAAETQLLGTADPEKTQLLRAGAVDDATRMLRPATELPHQPAPAEGGEEDFTDGTVHRARVKRWKRPLIAAAVVFGVTMGGITTYEIVAGHSFSGDSGSTTFRDAFSGHKSSGDSDPAPSTPEPSDDSSTASDSDSRQNGDDSSTDGNTTPSPTPSDSNGSDTGSDTGSDSDADNGSDSGSDTGDGKTTPTPTPTPTPSGSSGAGTGSGADSGRQSPTEQP